MPPWVRWPLVVAGLIVLDRCWQGGRDPPLPSWVAVRRRLVLPCIGSMRTSSPRPGSVPHHPLQGVRGRARPWRPAVMGDGCACPAAWRWSKPFRARSLRRRPAGVPRDGPGGIPLAPLGRSRGAAPHDGHRRSRWVPSAALRRRWRRSRWSARPPLCSSSSRRWRLGPPGVAAAVGAGAGSDPQGTGAATRARGDRHRHVAVHPPIDGPVDLVVGRRTSSTSTAFADQRRSADRRRPGPRARAPIAIGVVEDVGRHGSLNDAVLVNPDGTSPTATTRRCGCRSASTYRSGRCSTACRRAHDRCVPRARSPATGRCWRTPGPGWRRYLVGDLLQRPGPRRVRHGGA